MSKKLVGTSVFCALLFGCSTAPYQAPQAQIDTYFDNMKISPFVGEVEHKDHGKIKTTEQAYVVDYDQCQTENFQGKSFVFGAREVKDPKQLTQFSDDYLKEVLSALLAYRNSSGSGAFAGAMAATSVSTGTPMPSTNHTQYKKSIFDDKQVLSNIKGINDLEAKTLDCVKSKGWIFVADKKE